MQVIVWFVRMYGKIIHEFKLSYCTRMHVYFVHCEIFDIKHWNINERCNTFLYGLVKEIFCEI